MNISLLAGCILLGSVLQFFCFGRKMIPVAAWLAPIFLLHFSHAVPAEIGLPLVWLAIYAASLLAYRAVVPVPGGWYAVIVAAISLGSTLPYVADRLLYASLPGFAAAL